MGHVGLCCRRRVAVWPDWRYSAVQAVQSVPYRTDTCGCLERWGQVRPLLDAMGRGVVDVGPNPRTAAVTKLVGNSFIVGFAELLAETLALGEAQGVPTPVVANLATQLFPGPIPQGAPASPAVYLKF